MSSASVADPVQTVFPETFGAHLRLFLGATVDEDELRQIARVVVACNIRELKVSIAARVWAARQQQGAHDSAAREAHLQAARILWNRYAQALAEYRRLQDRAADPRQDSRRGDRATAGPGARSRASKTVLRPPASLKQPASPRQEDK